jgi:FkbM family methyltransferase
VLKQIVGFLPRPWQHAVRQLYYARQIRRGRFRSPEPEWDLVASLIKPGDWVIDIGANVGHYTLRLANLVGPAGRVIAVEPVPVTFALLAANLISAGVRNVSLFNIAASDTTSIAGIDIPGGDQLSGNYYQAHLSTSSNSALSVLCAPLDHLQLTRRVSLVKIDAEGHEAAVLRGMETLLRRDRPVLIVETPRREVMEFLSALDYSGRQAPGSPNCVLTHDGVNVAGSRLA